MLLHPAQTEIANDLHRFRVVVCGRKFGKTTLACEELMGKAIYHNGYRLLYVAPTLGEARGLMWDRLKNHLGRAILSANDTRLELKVATVSGGFSEIFLGSWELADSYRGYEYDFILFDEVQDYRKFWTGWHEAMRPTLTPRKGSALFTGTAKGFNHFYDLYNIALGDPDYRAFHYTTYDNPYIPRDEIEKAKQELTDDRFSQEYLAEFRKSEGLVFKEFRREKHVYSEDIQGYTDKLAGVDFGFTNPAAIPTVLFRDNAYYVSKLLYKTGMTDIQVAEYVAAGHYNFVYPDPESPAAIAEMKKKGVNIREVQKGKDSIKNGIDKMRELLLQNRLFIHASCLDLISELESYSYPEPRMFHNLNENPLDENNHAIDALRYVLSTHQVRRPVAIRPFNDKMVQVWRGK